METKYSLTTLLSNLLKLQNNGYEIITSLSDIVSSNSDTVRVKVAGATGGVTVDIPSYGALKNQIIKLENDIKSISGIGETTSSIQLSDGSFRKILISALQKEASDIKTLSTPTNFNKKENWFFESFMNPLLYVSFDLTGQVKYDTERVEVSRYILNLDTDEKVRLFNARFLNRSDISFNNFVNVLLNNGISYFLDKDTIDLPPRKLRYSGQFTVSDVTNSTVTETIDNAPFQKIVLTVSLDSLFYDDNQSRFAKTQGLKIGDSLIVENGLKNTRYQITSVDSSTRKVGLKLIEGFDSISVGTVLSYYGESAVSVSAEVAIGFNEYCVIFMKPIDPDSRIQSINWSPGVGIYTNNLNIIDPGTGNTVSLSTYYQNEVVDFGAYLYSTVKDKTPPSIFGVTPDPPTLQPTNFKVLQINQHLTESGSLDKLKKLQSDKLRVQSQIESNDKSIADLRNKIQTTRYTSQKLRDIDENQLSKLINERTSYSSLFSSTVDDINKITTSESLENLTPKFRVRGFFPIPSPKNSDRTSPQEVVQFIVQYRYIKKSGSANQPQQIEFLDENGQKRRGTFSNWIQTTSDIRERKINPNTGIAEWVTQDVENAETININQIDIPIQSGESVEFRIKSVSEAGWPVTPLKSQWSDIVRVDFPTEFESLVDAKSVSEQAKKDQVRIDLQSELVNMNLDKISENSFTQGNKFFVADSTSIASGFLTSENNVISLFDKLKSLEIELANIRALVTSAKGTISVRIVDNVGQEYTVENNSVIKLFAGNYRDEVSTLANPKGTILTKNYFVKISNTAASNLELYSRIYGSKYQKVNSSWVNPDTTASYNSSDFDYNSIRRYDHVPIGLSSPNSDDVSDYGFIRNSPEQSSQVRSQFINCRYKSVDGKRNLYNDIFPDQFSGASVYSSTRYLSGVSQANWTKANSIDDIDYIPFTDFNYDDIPASSGGGSNDFIWRGGTSSSSTHTVASFVQQVNDKMKDFILVHINHPDIPAWIEESGIDPDVVNNTIVPKYVRNSILGNIPKSNSNSNYQSSLFFEGTGSTANLYARVGFDDNDKFLIGPKSVGAYLFLNPKSHSDLIVNGSDSVSVKSVSFGNSSAITIPVTFQYRMTDYYGAGNDGIGNVGGSLTSTSSTNIEYTKTIGLDIYSSPKDKDRFSFDLEVTARYYSKSAIAKDIPTRTFENAIDDLTKIVKVTTPTTSRDVGTITNPYISPGISNSSPGREGTS